MANDIEKFGFLEKSGMLDAFEKLQQENRQLRQTIADVSSLMSCSGINSMVDFIIARLFDHFIPETLVFMLKHPRSDSIQQFYYKNLSATDNTLNEKIFYYFKGFFDANPRLFTNGEAAPFGKLSKQMGTPEFPEEFLAIRPEYIIPLIGLEGCCGILIFSNKITLRPYDDAQLFYIQNLFSVFTILIQNEIHYRNSITDPKTGLYTSDYLERRIQDKIASARRYKTQPAILMLDIDHFKKVNDTYGHLAGDKVLVELAKVLSRSVRTDDCVGRFGGEEFVILLAECKRDQLFNVCERIRLAAAKIEIPEQNAVIRITVSIGACMIEPAENPTPDSVIKRIDKAMYYSKENGRDRTTII